MADQKISAMPSAATLDGTEITPIVQAGVNKQVTTANYVSQVLNVNPVLTTQGGTNITSYTLGDTLYASATNTLAKLAGNTTTTQQFLTQTGTGSVSAVPIWKALAPSDINTQYGSFFFDFSTTLSGSITNTDTTIPVVTTSGFSTAGAVIIGAELITYSGKTSTSFTGCTRGAAGSPNVSHASGASVNGAQVATANTATLLQLNTQDLSNGVTLNTTTSEITVAIAGKYNFAFSGQLNNSTTSQSLLAIWFVLNGNNIANTTSWVTIASRENSTTPASALMAANVFLNLNAGDKVTLKWLSVDGHGSIVTYPASASPSYPAAPAFILTVNQVS
jgi:trimeric autotransporter adhesin